MADREDTRIRATKQITEMLHIIQKRRPVFESYANIILGMIARQYPEVYAAVLMADESLADDEGEDA